MKALKWQIIGGAGMLAVTAAVAAAVLLADGSSTGTAEAPYLDIVGENDQELRDVGYKFSAAPESYAPKVDSAAIAASAAKAYGGARVEKVALAHVEIDSPHIDRTLWVAMLDPESVLLPDGKPVRFALEFYDPETGEFVQGIAQAGPR